MYSEESINILFNEKKKTIRFVDEMYLEGEKTDEEEILTTSDSIEEAGKIVEVVKRFVPDLVEEDPILG